MTTAFAQCALQTDLGWLAMVLRGEKLLQLVIGHGTRSAALAALDRELRLEAQSDDPPRTLAERLTAYAAGEWVDLGDVPVELSTLAPFQRRVVAACRQIPYGQTRTYRELAAAAGSPQAARAVGNCMARNRLPLVIPCHRVVASGGGLGGFSAPGGLAFKRRLLALERAGREVARHGVLTTSH